MTWKKAWKTTVMEGNLTLQKLRSFVDAHEGEVTVSELLLAFRRSCHESQISSSGIGG